MYRLLWRTALYGYEKSALDKENKKYLKLLSFGATHDTEDTLFGKNNKKKRMPV